jgi:hypothetical protein
MNSLTGVRSMRADRAPLLVGENVGEVAFKLLEQQRNAVLEVNLNRVGIGALGGIV